MFTIVGLNREKAQKEPAFHTTLSLATGRSDLENMYGSAAI